MRLSRMRVRSCAILATVVTTGGLLAATSPASASPTPPPPPPSSAPPKISNGQISSAQAQKNQLASEVGRLSGEVAAAESALQELQGKAELAEQKVAFAVDELRKAQAAAERARARVTTAAKTVDVAHTKFVRYLQSSYMSGTSDTTTGTLLTANDPSALLEQTTLQRYEAENKVDAIGTLQTATVKKSNAQAAAQRATKRAKTAAKKARQAQQAADDAVAAQQAQEASLQQTLGENQTALQNKQTELANLYTGRERYIQYQRIKARYEAYQRYLAEQRRLAAQRKARALAAARAAALAKAQRKAELQRERERARKQKSQHGSSHSSHSSGSGGSGGGGNGGGGGGSGSHHSNHNASYNPPAQHSSGHGWSAARGREAVQRAMSQLGVPYAWAGGGTSGKGYGVCDSSNGAPNDCYVRGFDCSGLALYAWGPYLSMAHYALRQYSEAGHKHPSVGNLKPGDLIFYSYNGSVSGIHHVAVYKGHGKIIQAPYSGGYVEVSSMYGPGSIFGVTRPLT